MHPTARSKTVAASVAATCATVLAAGALVAGAEHGASAETGSTAKKVTIARTGVPYKCKATNSVVNDAIGGPQKFLVDGKAKFKGKFKPGTVVTPTGIRFTLILPKKLTRKVRRDLGVKKVRGSADAKFDVEAKPGGVTKMPVKGLKSGWKKVPKGKKLEIPATGSAGKFKIKKGTKRLSLLAPKTFMLHASLRPPAVGIVKKTDIRCSAMSGRKLGVFPL